MSWFKPVPVIQQPGASLPKQIVDHLRDILRFILYAGLRFWQDKCFGAASSLSYTSLLAIVPVVAISFAILSAFPVFDKIRTDILQFMLSNFLPSNVESVRSFFNTFLENTRSLTAVGIVALAVTAIILLDTIDTVFNAIWRQKQARPLHQRLLMYWAILTVTPLLLGGSLAISTVLMAKASWLTSDDVVSLWVRALPALFLFAAIALAYLMIPYRRVRARDALLGAAIVVLSFQVLRWGFQLYFKMFPSYQTLYGALALIPLSLVWMYLVWCVVLFGAQVAAAVPEWASRRLMGEAPSSMMRLARAFEVLSRLLPVHRHGGSIRDADFADPIAGAVDAAGPVFLALENGGIIARKEDESWLLARDLDNVTLSDLFDCLEIRPALILPPDAAARPWGARLEPLLALYQTAGQAALAVPIAAILAPEERPAKECPTKK